MHGKVSLSATDYEIFATQMCMPLTSIVSMAKLNVNTQIEIWCITFYTMAIVIFALSVTIKDIVAIEMCLT